MRHLAFGVCGLLAAWVAGAADPSFMVLSWGRACSDTPAEWGKLLDALGRYPSCFDTVRFEGKQPDGLTLEALKKLGIAAAPDSKSAPAFSLLSDDDAPRALIGHALVFAGSGGLALAPVGNGRHCASGKTAHGLCVESMLVLAYGAGGLEYDLMGYAHEPVAWTANTYLSELTLWRPFYQAYVRYNAETKPGGILPFCGKEGKPQLAGTLKAADALAPAGLPMCPGSPWPVCYMLNVDAVKSMTAVDIQRVLSGGVILDGGAVALLQERGYGAAMQLTAAAREPDVCELFTDDELNVSQVGYLWRPEATRENTYALTPSNEAARVIGRYQRADGKSAEAASVLFETPTGGRIAAFGFNGFNGEVSEARRRQLLLAADWVSQNRLPVFVETASQAVVVPRVSMAGDLRSVALLNATIDVQPPVTLRLRGCPEGLERMEWVTPKEKPVTVAVRWEAQDALVILPAVGPWQIGWIRAAE
jgi:hypothetical protein